MRVITLARKPLSEPTVAANVLEHGCGAINIDAVRIRMSGTDEELLASTASKVPQDHASPIYGKYALGGPPAHVGGRWPANLILEHLPGCQRAGKKQVAGILGVHCAMGAFGKRGRFHAARGTQNPRTTYADPDGTETIMDWECEPGCPVADLDAQSGDAGAAAPVRGTEASHAVERGGIYSPRGRVPGPFHGDRGGASRFFKQVKP